MHGMASMAEKKLSISIMILCFVFNIAVLNSNGTDGIKLEYCCKFTASSDQLMACVNDSNAKNYESWAHSAVLHPILRLVMVTRASPNVYEYAAYSYFVQSLYSAREGYTMLPLFADSPQQDYTYHRKLVPMLEALRDERNNADYIAWIDADLIPLDLNLKIEKVAATYRSAHIIMSSDVSSIGNTGFIIVRGGSQWAEAFFEEWLQQMNSPGVDTEQLGFDTVYRKRDQAEMNAKVAILAPHVLNSIAAPMGQQLPHHKVLHLAAESNAYRAAVFKAAAEEVCISLNQGRKPVHQLGISREFLQTTAREVYGEALQRLQEDIIQNPHKVSTALLAEYRTSASKYSHAVSYINNFQESEHTLQARWRAHSVVAGIALSRLQSLLLHAFEEEMVAFSSALDSSRFNSLRSNLAKLYAHTAGLSALRDFMGQNLDELLPVLSKYVAYLTTILESDGTDCAGQQQQSPPQPPIHSTRRKEQVAQHNLQKAAPDNSNGDDQSDMDIRMDSMHCADLQHWRDLPEVLKLSAELSYELLGLLPPPPPPSISTPTADTVYTLSDTSQHIGSAAVGAAMASTEGIDLFSVDLKKRGTRKQATLFPNNVKEMRQDLRSHIQICLDILLRVVHPSQQSIVNIMLSEFAQSQLW